MLPEGGGCLSANRDRMKKLVDALLKYDTISRREFVTLMETARCRIFRMPTPAPRAT